MNIFVDEHDSCQIDFTKTVWTIDNLHDIFSVVEGSLLSDVDFIAESKDKLLFIEYKNSNIKHVDKPKDFNSLSEDSINKVARKYYDSLNFIQAIGGKRKRKKKIYIYLVETPTSNKTTRKGIRNRLKKKLPFKLQEKNGLDNMITDVQVLSIDEWKQKYRKFPINRLKEPLRQN